MKKKFIPFILIAAFAVSALVHFSFKSKSLYWMMDQISEDLGCYSKEDLNPDRIETSYQSLLAKAKLVHFQIKGNQIYWKANFHGEGEDRVRKVCIMLSKASRFKKLPDTDFLLTVHDGIISKSSKKTYPQYLPIFCFAKRKGVHAVLFPDPLTESFARRRKKSIALEKMKPKHYWKNKKEVAFWRGGTTGGPFLIDNWYQMPRTQLALLTQYYPNEVDAGFSVHNKMPDNVKEEMLKCLPLVKWSNHKKHLQYKYLVVADGNTCTYPRFYLGLYSGSVVFKDQTDDYQWFYRALKPGKHFIAVSKDFSNLPEKVIWAKNNDKKVKQIARNSQKFIRRNLTSKHIYQYIVQLLNEYSKLQDSEVKVLDDMYLYQGSRKNKWKKNG